MLLAIAMVVSLLTGCGSKNNSAEDTTKEETQTEATAEAAVDESNDTTADDAGEETTITVFAAKSREGRSPDPEKRFLTVCREIRRLFQDPGFSSVCCNHTL